MTKCFIIRDEYNEYEVFEHTRKKPIICDDCDNKINKGDYWTESDAGDKYCEKCSTR